jgi:carbon-monoxide dehydrogenase iron sulfur subunit
MKRIYVNEMWCLGCHLCEYYCAYANSGVRIWSRH